MEQFVTSPELSIQMKDASVPQSERFIWVPGSFFWDYEGEWHIDYDPKNYTLVPILNPGTVQFRFDTSEIGDEHYMDFYDRMRKVAESQICSAFLSDEILRMLPRTIRDPKRKGVLYWLQVNHEEDGRWVCGYFNPNLDFFVATEANSIPNMAAKMLLHLIEQKIINVEDLNGFRCVDLPSISNNSKQFLVGPPTHL